MSKYNNKKCTYNGHTFDSRMEKDFYVHLLSEQEKGLIREIKLQPEFELQPAYIKNGKKIRAINYVGDFLVEYADGRKELIDIKGQELPVYLLKKKILEYKYDIEIKAITHSKIDSGWIELGELKKARKQRKIEKDKIKNTDKI